MMSTLDCLGAKVNVSNTDSSTSLDFCLSDVQTVSGDSFGLAFNAFCCGPSD